MTPSMKSLGIDRLSAGDRLALLDEIWDSLRDAPGDLPLSDAIREELHRRLADHHADPDSGSSWEEVRSRVWGES